MTKTKQKVKRVNSEAFTISLPPELLKEFRDYCNENGINMSGRIAKLIKEDLSKSQ